MTPWRWLALGFLLPTALSCKLTEDLIGPPGRPVLVVQAVLNTAHSSQEVRIERSYDGTASGLVELSGATVTLIHLSPGDCPAPTVELSEIPPDPRSPVPEPTGRYTTNQLCPLQPGDRVALRVETADGKVVTGTTRVPGARAVSLRAGNREAQSPPAEFTVSHAGDTLRAEVDPLFGRALQVEVTRKERPYERPQNLHVEAMRVSVAANFVDPFAGSDGRHVFRAGAVYLLTIAVTDTNYFDFVRSRSDPFTGRGFINHLTGGIGVFGSVAPFTYEIRPTAPQRDPREGAYRISGRLGSTDVDVNLDVYLDSLEQRGNGFSAFVEGVWLDGPVRSSADGAFFGAAFSAQLYTVPGLQPDFLSGTRTEGGVPFDVRVSYVKDGKIATGTVTAVQVSGPR